MLHSKEREFIERIKKKHAAHKKFVADIKATFEILANARSKPDVIYMTQGEWDDIVAWGASKS